MIVTSHLVRSIMLTLPLAATESALHGGGLYIKLDTCFMDPLDSIAVLSNASLLVLRT